MFWSSVSTKLVDYSIPYVKVSGVYREGVSPEK